MPAAYTETFIDQYGKPPTDQSVLTLTLVMIGPNLSGGTWEHQLFTKPEDLTYTHPTRATVIQTLGGAFMDDFGEGITDITVSGHTGWHYAPDINGELGSLDGAQKMYDLRYYFFQVYHEQRMLAAKEGRSPDEISLYFIDTLNNTAYRVYPLSLQVRKNKNRPMLFQYQLRMVGLEKIVSDGDAIDWPSLIDDIGDWIGGLA